MDLNGTNCIHVPQSAVYRFCSVLSCIVCCLDVPPARGEVSLRAEVNSKPPIAQMDMGKRGFVSQTHKCSLADFKEAMECPSPITAIPSVPGTKLALALSRSPDTLKNGLAAQPRQTSLDDLY